MSCNIFGSVILTKDSPGVYSALVTLTDRKLLQTYSSHWLTYRIVNDNLQIASSIEEKNNTDNYKC